jgi:hypothetical protein
LGIEGIGKMHFDKQSPIFKTTNYIYNFITQQCQAIGLRRTNRLLSVKSQLGNMAFNIVDFVGCLSELQFLYN